MKLKVRNQVYQKQTEPLRVLVQQVVESYKVPITTRQVFYRLVAMRKVPNTKDGYRQVQGLVKKGRYTGHIDWDKITDETRGVMKHSDWPDIEIAIEEWIEYFRLNRWRDNPYYVEMFVEKRGMTNTLYPLANRYHVALVPCGGFDSTSDIWESFNRIKVKQDEGKKIVLLYLGDFDISGDSMHDDVEKRLREFGIDFHEVRRVLLNRDQVDKYDLPISYKNMAKKITGEIYDKLKADPRAKRFKAKNGKLMQVECDALDPAELVRLTEEAILEYFDEEKDLEVRAEEEVAQMKMRKKLLN